MLVQTISSEGDILLKYYTIIATLNSIKLTRSELKLLAFIAQKGGTINKALRIEFQSLNDLSYGSVQFMLKSLRLNKLLIKDKVNPVILQDNKDITIQIKLWTNP